MVVWYNVEIMSYNKGTMYISALEAFNKLYLRITNLVQQKSDQNQTLKYYL